MMIYFSVIKLLMKSILSNKSSVFILLLQSLVPISIMFYLWSSILNRDETLGGFSRNQLILYYVGVNFINFFVWYAIDWELNSDIHSGELSNILHKPISIQKYYFFRMVGDRMANLFILSPLILMGGIYIIIISKSKISIILVFQFLISLFLSTVLWFLFSYIVGSLAFWFENLFFVLLVKEVLVSLLAGYYFPISILPDFWQSILQWLPFQYFSSFPINVLIKGMTGKTWLMNTLLELTWIVGFGVTLSFVSRKGLQKYSDVAG